MNRVAAALEMAKRADCYHIAFSYGEYSVLPKDQVSGWRVVTEGGFAPWSSLDDAAELASALKAAGLIQNMIVSAVRAPVKVVIDRGYPTWKTVEAPTEAEARFRALCLALGIELDGVDP